MPQETPDAQTLARLVARHLDVGPERLALRRSPTGKFNDTYFVEGGPVPLVLRIAPPDDRLRMLFYEHRTGPALTLGKLGKLGRFSLVWLSVYYSLCSLFCRSPRRVNDGGGSADRSGRDHTAL